MDVRIDSTAVAKSGASGNLTVARQLTATAAGTSEGDADLARNITPLQTVYLIGSVGG